MGLSGAVIQNEAKVCPRIAIPVGVDIFSLTRYQGICVDARPIPFHQVEAWLHDSYGHGNPPLRWLVCCAKLLCIAVERLRKGEP